MYAIWHKVELCDALLSIEAYRIYASHDSLFSKLDRLAYYRFRGRINVLARVASVVLGWSSVEYLESP